MISEVFITCAVTGGGLAPKQKNVPVTPQEIADSAIEAARAGAAAVHLHVRDLKNRQGVLDLGLYQELVKRIRNSDVKPVINLTTGEGCYLVLGSPNAPLPLRRRRTCWARSSGSSTSKICALRSVRWIADP